MEAGEDVPAVVVEAGRFHSLEVTNELGVVLNVKSAHFEQKKKKKFLVLADLRFNK